MDYKIYKFIRFREASVFGKLNLPALLLRHSAEEAPESFGPNASAELAVGLEIFQFEN